MSLLKLRNPFNLRVFKFQEGFKRTHIFLTALLSEPVDSSHENNYLNLDLDQLLDVQSHFNNTKFLNFPLFYIFQMKCNKNST